MYEFWGEQILCNMSGLQNINLNNTDYLLETLEKVICEANATLVKMTWHEFSPEGTTIIAILKESHVAIHIYPEHQALFFDAFTCGKIAQPKKMAHLLIEELKPEQYILKKLIRSRIEITEKSF